MSVLRHIVTAGGGLAVALMAAPMIALEAQVVAPGTNPRPTTYPAPAPNPATTPGQSGDQEMSNDLPFLRVAAGANLLEIRLGQLALSKASNTTVKEFGQRMVTDHTRLEQELSSMVSRNGIALNAGLSSEQNDKINRLQNVSGQQFDQAYMSMMIQAHQTDVTQFQHQSRNAASAQVRDFAARSLPVLQAHLSLAQQVGGQVNVEVATTPQREGSGQISAGMQADNEFIREVTADNMLQVRLAELAQRKAQSSAVKHFAERIASDHNRLQDDWVNLVSVNGQQFKPGMGTKHRVKLDRLEKLSGRAFDRAYMTTEMKEHRGYINYFETEGRAAHSNQVREMVRRELPMLHTHFNQAKQIGGQVGADTDITLRSNERGSAKK
jgi:putative membrane protein